MLPELRLWRGVAVAILLQALLLSGQALDLSRVREAESCLASGRVLDLYSPEGSSLIVCVAPGACPAGSSEVFRSCVLPWRQATMQDLAVTLHLPCDGCLESQGVDVAKTLWLDAARSLHIPIQEIRAAALLVPSSLRKRFPLRHFALRGLGEMPPVTGFRSIPHMVSASSVELFVTLRINTVRLNALHGGLQAFNRQAFWDGPMQLHFGSNISVVEVAEHSSSLEFSREAVSPWFMFEGSAWNAQPRTGGLRGADSAVFAFKVDWLSHVPESPPTATKAALLVGPPSRRMRRREEPEEDTLIPSIAAAGTLFVVVGGVGLTFWCLEVKRRQHRADRVKVLSEMKQESSDEGDTDTETWSQGMPPQPAPGSLNYVRPGQSRGNSRASRSLARAIVKPHTAPSRPRSAGMVSDRLDHRSRGARDRDEMRRNMGLQGQAKSGAPVDWSVGWAEETQYRPSSACSTRSARESRAKAHRPQTPTEPRPGTGRSGISRNHPEFKFLQDSTMKQAKAAVEAISEENMRCTAETFYSQGSCVFAEPADSRVPNRPEEPPPTYGGGGGSQSRSSTGSRWWRPRWAYAFDDHEPMSARSSSSSETATGHARARFEATLKGSDHQPPPSRREGWAYKRSSSTPPDLPPYAAWPRPGTGCSWTSENGEFQRPPTLKARGSMPDSRSESRPETRREPTPEPAGRFRRVAAAAVRVVGRQKVQEPEPPAPVAIPTPEEPEPQQDPAEQAEHLVAEMLDFLETSRGEPFHVRKLIFRDMQRQLHPDKNTDCEEAAKLAFQKLMEQRQGYLRNDW